MAPTAALLREVKFNPTILRKLLAIGLPTGLQMLTIAVAELILLGLVNRHGSNAAAAYGAVTQLMNWLQFPVISLGMAATLIASHAIGAGRAHRLGAIARIGLWMNLLFTGAFVALAYAMAPTVLGWFLTDASVIALALHLLRLVAWTMPLRGEHGAGRCDASQWHRLGAHGFEHAGHLVGLRGHLHLDVGVADGFLPAGLAPPQGRAIDLDDLPPFRHATVTAAHHNSRIVGCEERPWPTW